MGAFIGEFLVLVGAFEAFSDWAILAAIGVIFSAVYMLWMFQRVLYQSLNKRWENLADMNLREVIYIFPLLVIVFWIGLYPETFTSYIHESVKQLVEHMATAAVAMK